MKKYLLRFRQYVLSLSPSEIRVGREQIKDGDRTNKREFVMSHMCATIEKELRNRTYERMETASDGKVPEEERMKAIHGIEEIKDILAEWANLRTDLKDGTNQEE